MAMEPEIAGDRPKQNIVSPRRTAKVQIVSG
jgi:hypothetical protein